MENAGLPDWIRLEREARSIRTVDGLIEWRKRRHRPSLVQGLRLTSTEIVVSECDKTWKNAKKYPVEPSLDPWARMTVVGARCGLCPLTSLCFLCSSDLSTVSLDILLGTIRSLLADCPGQVRCSQCFHGHTALRASVRNISCPSEVVDVLLQHDQLLSSSMIFKSDAAIQKSDGDGLSIMDHLLQQLHLASSPFALKKLQTILNYGHHKDGRNGDGLSLLRLLSFGDSCGRGASLPRENELCLAEAVKLVLESRPLDAFQSSRITKCTPLHIAIRNFGREDSPILSKVLDFYMKSRDGDAIFRARNLSGDLPLHVACRIGVPLETWRLILDQTVETYVKLGGNSNCASQHVLSANNEGYNPVELAWINYMESSSYPVFSAADGWRMSASKDRRRALFSSLVERTVVQIISSDLCPEGAQLLGDLQRRTFLLICAASGSKRVETAQTNEDILHVASSLSGPNSPALSLPMLNLVLWRFPRQVSTRDCFGKLPLHRAVESIENPGSVRDNSFSESWAQWVKQLTSQDLGAGSIADHRGRLPLHYALGTASHCDALDVDRARDWVARYLVSQCPQCVERFDPSSGLPPFVIAAANPCLSLSTVYDVLRQSPSMVSSYNRN